MIQNDNLAPDAKRRTVSFARDKSAATPANQVICSTHNRRFQITNVTLQILEATATNDFVIYVAPYAGTTAVPDSGSAVMTWTDTAGAGLSVGVYNYGRGNSFGGVTLPYTLAADQVWGFLSSASVGGNGAAILTLEIEPLDDNPTQLR